MKLYIKVGHDYYLGGTYIHQGEHFPQLTGSEEGAKAYKSLPIAKRALATLKRNTGTNEAVVVDEQGNPLDRGVEHFE